MEWITKADQLLHQNKPAEALALIKGEFDGDNDTLDWLLIEYDRRLAASAINLEKGSLIMAEALTEKLKVRYELERLLKKFKTLLCQ